MLALGFICGLGLPAVAQQPTFFDEAKPLFDNCGDPSLAKAQKDGITLGFSQAPPEAFLDEKTKQPSGIDWEINKAVLDWLGVKTIKIEWMPWESQIPALLSKCTDVVAGNIHHTPTRDKVISFSGPAWWYGPVIVAAKGNPLGIKTYEDLKGKRIGSISGSAADDYLRHIGVTTTPFKVAVDELQSLNQGRLDAVLEDDIVYLDFAKECSGQHAGPAVGHRGAGLDHQRRWLRHGALCDAQGRLLAARRVHAGPGRGARQRSCQFHPEEVWAERPQPGLLQAQSLISCRSLDPVPARTRDVRPGRRHATCRIEIT